MGRPPKLTPIMRRARGEESLADIGRSYNVQRGDDFPADTIAKPPARPPGWRRRSGS
jgi:hypothetical protein